MTGHTHRALADCPVCGEHLTTTRLGCEGCGTELVGRFAPCPFCALDDANLEALKVFLVSRGNLKDFQAHLGVSYPTARARFNDLLARLGWEADDAGETVDETDAEPTETPETKPQPDPEPEPVAAPSGTPDSIRDQVLAQVASGVLSPAVAADLLGQLR